MKLNIMAILLIALAFCSCIQKSHQTESKQTPNKASLSNDTADLKKLTENLYYWYETKSSKGDFTPLKVNQTDTVYAKLDSMRNVRRINELEKTNLFANQFIENYHQIIVRIDQKLRKKILVWNIAELLPFGNGADPWCNCQDNPDNYWEKITLKRLVVNRNNASYYWTWGDNFEYKVNAVKVNGAWKISYLQGFDLNEFIPE